MPDLPKLSRRKVVAALTGLGIGSVAFAKHLGAQVAKSQSITAEMVRQAEWLAGIELRDEQREQLASGLVQQLAGATRIREVPLDADVPPAMIFRPDFFAEPSPAQRIADAKLHSQPNFEWKPNSAAALPSNEELPWSSLTSLVGLLFQRKISSRELTQMYLDRLRRFDPLLKCVITPLDEMALKQATVSDERRAKGESLSVLDGVPWVAKDLIAVPPWKTTWGADPYREQVRPNEATVAAKLREAGGVLLAKVTLGALAQGDKWFDGMTRNPWDPNQGSSGSSAGTASAVAAGLTAYGIGSETLGSIVSPCIRCRVSGLRPTFGRSSRYGCMALSWSMDKLGPIARRVEDLALVFAHMLGSDGKDPTVTDRPFNWPERKPLKEMTIGFVEGSLRPSEAVVLDWLKEQGARVKSISLPSRFPLSALTVILNAESTTMFDDILRNDPDAELGTWPGSFRKGQFISAVHYLRANRVRTMLIAETEAVFREVDVVLGSDDLSLTNLTGHPSLIVTTGSEEIKDQETRPGYVKFTAAMFRESTLLAIGKAIQDALPPTPASPPLERFLAASRDKQSAEQ